MKRSLKGLSFLLIFVGLVAMSGEDRIYPGNWAPSTENIPEKVFEWKPSKYPFETSTIFMLEKMDNGGWFIVYFFDFRTPVMQKWGVIVTLVTPDGKRHFFKDEIPARDIETRPGSAYIRLGKNVFEGTAPNYRLTLDVGGFKGKIQYNNRAPTWRPGNGVMYYTEDKKIFSENSVMLSLSRASGKLEYEGINADAAGWAYGDRAFTNVDFFKQNEMIYSVRAFPKQNDKTKYGMSMLEYKAHRSYGGVRIPWIIIMSEGKYLVSTKNYKLDFADYRKDPNTGYTYPWRIIMTGNDRDSSFRLVSQANRQEEVLDVIDELPAYLRPIVKKFFARPVFYRFSGTVTGLITGKDGTNIPLNLDGYSEVVFVQKN